MTIPSRDNKVSKLLMVQLWTLYPEKLGINEGICFNSILTADGCGPFVENTTPVAAG